MTTFKRSLMSISKELIAYAIQAIAAMPCVQMSPQSLAEDAILLSYAFTMEEDYLAAVASTCRALSQIEQKLVTTVDLKYQFATWQCYHYQHKVAQGQRANMRIVFRRTKEGIQVRAFGHRRLPHDF